MGRRNEEETIDGFLLHTDHAEGMTDEGVTTVEGMITD